LAVACPAKLGSTSPDGPAGSNRRAEKERAGVQASIWRHRIWWGLLTVLVVAGVGLGAWRLAYLRQFGDIERQLQDRLTINLRSVESEIERFRYLPGVISQDERIVSVLLGDGQAAVAVANRYLQTVRGMSGADELYVLDLDGETLAASNWNEPGSFVGHNYAFRPYFLDAMAAGSGRFYAVGVTTGKPGYFLSSRVEADGRPIGVAIAKVDMAPLAATWAAAGEMTAIADGDGVIFLSGEPGWTYRPLQSLDDETLMRLKAERRYEGAGVAAAAPLAPGLAAGGASHIVTLLDDAHLLGRRAIEPDGWQLLSALPLAPVEREARLVGGLAALLAIVGFGAWAFLHQRRQITRFKLEQNVVLERRVAERTQALGREVEERRRAETELRTTQESLVHAAKLTALGRMSAAIVHEVSQPLSALDSTLAAADLHAGRKAMVEVRRNLASARDLLRRMQRTVKHLRTFSSRRDPSPPEPVAIDSVIEAALEIVAPHAKETGVRIIVRPGERQPRASGNTLRLEQVFTNLILNAIDATASAGNDVIHIAISAAGERLTVEIADTGPGMSDAVRERLFEPFFTTKTTGESLGLGLSITRALLEEFGGTLQFGTAPQGGTLASVTLPVFAGQAAAEPVPA